MAQIRGEEWCRRHGIGPANTQEWKMRIRIGRLVGASVLLTLLTAAALFGQTFGELTGHVSDATGAAVPGARVTLTNVATNAARTAATTDSGDYTFPAVAPGFYNVRVEQPSFKAATSNNVQIQVQQTLRLDFTLEVGQVTESVQVSASAEMLQADDTSLGTVIETKAGSELPLNGRNY